jgi:GAF domain-containing protein
LSFGLERIVVKPPVPYNEKERLRVLGQYNILDTPPEDRFDAIVLRAASQFNVPIALFSLIDESRQWCKSQIGLDIRETDRAISFCAHVIAIDAPLVVEDTSTNDEFANNPLVVGHPRISFYAGVPVRALTGEPLGALCIIDTSARRFPWKDFLLLGELAGQIEVQLEARQAEALRSSNWTMH